jgi:hypothetical protein
MRENLNATVCMVTVEMTHYKHYRYQFNQEQKCVCKMKNEQAVHIILSNQLTEKNAKFLYTATRNATCFLAENTNTVIPRLTSDPANEFFG